MGQVTRFEVANGLPHDVLAVGVVVLVVALLSWPIRAGARAIRRLTGG